MAFTDRIRADIVFTANGRTTLFRRRSRSTLTIKLEPGREPVGVADQTGINPLYIKNDPRPLAHWRRP